MAPPPAKRRKRNVIESDDEREEDDARQQARKNNLQNFLFSSPDAKSKPAGSTAVPSSPAASPSPARKSTRSAPATRASNGASKLASSLFAAGGRGGAVRALGSRQLSASKSPSTSPEKKGRGQKKVNMEEKGKSADLLTLFSKQAQKAQLNGKKKKEEEEENASDVLAAIEDIISDPISEEDDVAESKTAVSSLVGQKAQKRWKGSSQPALSSASSSTCFTNSQQRFLKPPRPPPSSAAPAGSSTAAAANSDDHLRPWTERFAPRNLDELAVHKKKVADVRRWLEDVLSGRMRQRLLILKGAAGTGKTTTVQLLARDMGCEVLEWRNPAGSLGATQGYASASAQFEEFMTRGGRFGQLDIDDSDAAAAAATALPQTGRANGPLVDTNGKEDHRRTIILIEEFPNTFMRSSTALAAFRSTILQYLAMNTPALATFGQQSPDDPVIPVVMVISETLLTTTSASADSFTAHRLLGPEILRHPGTCLIEFNAIAPSILAKALELVVQKEARRSGRRRTPGPQVLRRLGEVGDIRSAVSSLEFLCVKGDEDADYWGAKVAFTTKGRKGKGAKDAELTRGERESLEAVSQREASLGIFHAVGKVVYNKRDEQPSSGDGEGENLPAHLARFARPKRSQVAVDTLIDETGTDAHTFISALHENYALSCERTSATDPNSSLDYINGCLEYLSESDLLCPSWDVFFGSGGGGRRGGWSGGGGHYGFDTGSHVLRQDEMAFQVAVRGMLFSLPSPVKRQSAPSRGGGGGGSGGDQFKMFFPTSLKLWRAKEELQGLVDMWSSKMLKGELVAQVGGGPAAPSTQAATPVASIGAGAFRKPKATSSVGDSATNRSEMNYMANQKLLKEQKQRQQEEKEKANREEPAPPPLLSLGSSARKEMLLERLPYMAHIARGRKCTFILSTSPSPAATVRELEKVVSFQGVGAASTLSPEEAEEGLGDEDGGVGAGSAADGVGAEAWATDKPAEDSASPRKNGRGRYGGMMRIRAAVREAGEEGGSGSIPGGLLQMHKLVLSDDDIEDD